jgi:uncharacterized protein (DUF608 family)
MKITNNQIFNAVDQSSLPKHIIELYGHNSDEVTIAIGICQDSEVTYFLTEDMPAKTCCSKPKAENTNFYISKTASFPTKPIIEESANDVLETQKCFEAPDRDTALGTFRDFCLEQPNIHALYRILYRITD